MGQKLRYKQEKAQIGKIESFAHESADSARFLFCDGSLLLIADYPELYAKIGTNWGGDGVTDFRLPDMRGRTIRGKDAGAGQDVNSRSNLYSGGNTGDNVGSYQDDNLQGHQHSVLYANSGQTTFNGSNAAGFAGGNTPGPFFITANNQPALYQADPFVGAPRIGQETTMKNALVGFYIRYTV